MLLIIELPADHGLVLPELTSWPRRASSDAKSQVTRIGAGPNGMTIKSSDASDVDDYLAAK